MTFTEAKVYLVISYFGETRIGPIIDETGLHRGTVYNVINSLIKKGFVGYVDTEDSRIYSITGIKVFEKFLEDKERDINLDKEVIKDLKNSKVEVHDESKVKVLVGEKGFKQFFSEMIDWANRTKREYLFIGRGQEMITHFGEDYYTYTQNLKKKFKIKCRAILSSAARTESVSSYVYGNVRYYSWDNLTPTSVWIYEDRVVIGLWEAKPVKLVEIRSEELNKTYRNYFEVIWKNANKKYILNRAYFNIIQFMAKSTKSLDLLGMCCIEPIHDGRASILSLLSKGGRVRILLGNPDSLEFKKRVKDEELFLKSYNESRIVYELKAALANLKDIKLRSNGKGKLNVRMYDSKPNRSLIISDGKKAVDNKYSDKKGEYGVSGVSNLFDDKYNQKKIKKLIYDFESLWNRSKEVSL